MGEITFSRNFSREIKRRTSVLGLRAAAREIGISPTTLSRLSRGGLPDMATFISVCRWLDMDPGLFFDRDGRASE